MRMLMSLPPSALEKTNQLNRLHMLLREAEGGVEAALPIKEKIFKHCCRYCSPNCRAVWAASWAPIPRYHFSMRTRYPRPCPGLENLLPLPIWPSELEFGRGHCVSLVLFFFLCEIKELEREREGEGEREIEGKTVSSCKNPNQRNKD